VGDAIVEYVRFSLGRARPMIDSAGAFCPLFGRLGWRRTVREQRARSVEIRGWREKGRGSLWGGPFCLEIVARSKPTCSCGMFWKNAEAFE